MPEPVRLNDALAEFVGDLHKKAGRTMTSIETAKVTTIPNFQDLAKANEGSWYTIIGVDNPQEYVDGYIGLLEEALIDLPKEWFTATGMQVNAYAMGMGTNQSHTIRPDDLFPEDLTFLLFPLTGIEVGRLALFKIRMEDRWFDDVIANMRGVGLL